MSEKALSLKDAEVRLLLSGATLIVVPVRMPTALKNQGCTFDGAWVDGSGDVQYLRVRNPEY